MEDKRRLEAFSDGVFAVAATLLVLEFTVNHHSKIGLGQQLLDLWPAYLAYATSFVTIGIIWINHHHTVSLLGRSDRTMLFINNLLLLTIVFLPFPTRLVAEDLHHGVPPGDEKSAVLAYSATFVVMALLHLVWWEYARRNRRLIADTTPDSALRGRPRLSPGRADVRHRLRRRLLQPARRGDHDARDCGVLPAVSRALRSQRPARLTPGRAPRRRPSGARPPR